MPSTPPFYLLSSFYPSIDKSEEGAYRAEAIKAGKADIFLLQGITQAESVLALKTSTTAFSHFWAALQREASNLHDAARPTDPNNRTPDEQRLIDRLYEDIYLEWPSNKRATLAWFVQRASETEKITDPYDLIGKLVAYNETTAKGLTNDAFYELWAWYHMSLVNDYVRQASVSYRLIGRVTDTNGQPRKDVRISAEDGTIATSTRAFGMATSDRNGYYAIRFTVLEGVETTHKLNVTFTHPEVQPAETQVLDFDVDKATEPLGVELTFTPPVSKSKTVASTGVSIPGDVQAFLTANSISVTRLEDIRRMGGFRNIPGVDTDNANLKKLDGLASLELLQDDVTKNNTLYTRGYQNITEVALTPRGEFIEANSDLFGDYGAAQLHYMAKAGHLYGINLQAEELTAVPQHDGNTPSASGGAQSCDCPDCKSGVSPLAYLCDLIAFAQNNLRHGNTEAAVDLVFLSETFHQRFGDIRVSCSQLNEKICQNRIATEVLRSYLIEHPPTGNEVGQLATAEKEYLTQAYDLLLGKLGTSYTELRKLRATETTDVQRERLADRMGIMRADSNGPTLEQVLIDLGNVANIVEGQNSGNAKGLEQLFGLRDTNRDVFQPTPESKVVQWKKAKLREEWKKADGLSDPYWPSSALDREVIIDPDVVTPDDLRFPIPADPAFTLWKKRRDWIDAEWDALDTAGTTVGKAKDAISDANVIIAHRALLPINVTQLGYRRNSGENLAYSVREAFHGNGNTYYLVDEPIADDEFGGRVGVAGADAWDNLFPIRNCASMIERLTAPSTTSYNGSPIQLNWPQGIAGADVIDSLRSLVTQALAGSATAAAALANRHLDPSSGARLIALYDTNLAHVDSYDPEGGLIPEEWSEFKSILIQMLKNKLSEPGGVWRTEESPALLGPQHFRRSIHEPQVGELRYRKNEVLLDPDVNTVRELPEITLLSEHDAFGGDHAVEILATRRTELGDDLNALVNAHVGVQGFADLLDLALGNPTLTWTSDPSTNDYLSLLNDLANPARKAWAELILSERLYLTEAELRLVITLGTKEQNDGPLAANEQNSLYTTLLRAYKQRVRLAPSGAGSWVAAENSTSAWKLRKTTLPLWRSSRAKRDAWLQALAEHSERPIIDADLIGPGDLLFPAEGNPTYERFDACWRDMHGNAEYPNTGTGGAINVIGAGTFFASNQQTVANFDTLTQQHLGHAEPSLAAIHVQQEDGVDIRPRIAQLTLTSGEFNQLMGYRDLLVAGANSLTGEELTTIKHILAQVEKRRKFFDYRLAEIAAGITLSQDHFKIREQAIASFPPQPDRPLTPSLATERDLILWRRTLKGRVEQEKSVLDAWQEALYEVDEAMMVHLRDALVQTTGNSTQNLTIKARNLGDKLLIDLENNCCYKTNRVAVAIETLQQLIWKTRTADINAHYPTLRYQGDDFDEAWTWMGNYANWRAAMFVFLYPENVLHPSLRKNMTPAFREVVEATRNNRRFVPIEACKAADNYRKYVVDISDLEVKCAQRADGFEGGTECGSQHNAPHALTFIFAQAKGSKRPYYTVMDFNSAATPEQVEHWTPIPRVEEDSELKGSDLYVNNSENINHVYLFYTRSKAEHDGNFFAVRFNLNIMEWEEEEPISFPIDASELANEYPHEPFKTFDPSFFSLRIVSLKVLKNTFSWQVPSLAISLSYNFEGRITPYTFTRNLASNGITLQSGESGDNWITKYYSPTSHGGLGGLNTGWNTGHFRSQLIGEIVDYWSYHPNNGGWDWREVVVFFILRSKNYSTDQTVTRMVRKKIINDEAGRYDTVAYELYPSDAFFHQMIVDQLNSRLFVFASSYAEIQNNLMPTKVYTYDQSIFLHLGEIDSPGTSLPSQNATFNSSIPNTIFHFTAVNCSPNNQNGLIPIIYKLNQTNKITVVHGSLDQVNQDFNWGDDLAEVVPQFSSSPIIGPVGSEADQEASAHNSATSWQLSEGSSSLRIVPIQETFFFVPMQIALQLHANGHYQSALDWFRSVYDFRQPLSSRKISYLLRQEETLTTSAQRIADWYADPLNPHAIAATRRHTYTRYTILCIVHCLLDYADAEFTSDTSESVPRARELYEDALSLMKLLVAPRNCAIDQLAGTVKAQVDDASWLAAWNDTLKRLEPLVGSSGFGALLQSITTILAGGAALAVKLDAVNSAIDAAISSHGLPTVTEVLNDHVVSTAALTSGALGSMDADLALQQLLQQNATSYTQAMKAVTGLTTIELETKSIPWLVDDRAISGFDHGYVREYINPGKQHVLQNLSEEHPAKSFNLNNPFPNVWLSGVPFSFCVVPNPIAGALVMKAEVELWKIHNCMNIAGMVRELDPFAAPTDSTTGIPMIGAAGGSIAIPSERTIPPSAYRYRTIVERARQLVGMAQQVEAAFLATLEKLDAERYSQLRAEQDIETSTANIKLQDLKINEANSGVRLAELQRQRADLQVTGLDAMITAPFNAFELDMMRLFGEIASTTVEANWYGFAGESASFAQRALNAEGVLGKAASVVLSGIGILAALGRTAAQNTLASLGRDLQLASFLASHARRQQEWEFQRTLANQDVKIGDQQIKLANDRLRITGQEREIAVLQNEHARATLDFLKNKFTSADLYEWMSRVLEDAYSWFLQEATAIAMLAQRQLAFERQLDLPPFIRSDYWIVDGGSMGGVDLTGEGAVDRRGLTGSTRLLKDLTELDQYAFSTNSPKLQLTKTIALSELAPEELIALRDSGIARFYTTQGQFDRDYPGHYLRLIKRVSVTVIALTPPTKGIRATLANGPASNVVVGGTIFQERVIKRFPEVVAFSSGVGDHGVFQLQPDGEFLHPFEGSGVETAWEFRMEKAANPFDFGSIADVLFAIEYEALNSFTYRNTVAQRLNQEPAPSAVAISLKNNLPDQWFDLHNPQVPGAGYQVSFQINQRDLAPNLSAPYSITRAVAYAIMKDGSEFRYLMGLNRGAPAETLAAFSEQGLALLSVPADPGDGPIGTWNLAFAPDGGTQPPDPFANKLVEDIFIVLTYEGESTPYLLV